MRERTIEHLPHQTPQTPDVSRPTRCHLIVHNSFQMCNNSSSTTPPSHHFSVLLAAVAGLLASGGSYLQRNSSDFRGTWESPKGCMNSTPPSFHSPASSTKMEERQMFRWTRPQSVLRKPMAFCWSRQQRHQYTSAMLYDRVDCKLKG